MRARDDDASIDLLRAYRPSPGVYDECVDAEGRPRAHWRPLLARLAALGRDGLEERQRALLRRLQASGVAFNVYARPEDRKAAWDLDPIPVVLGEADWQTLERALVQRVRLAEGVLRDVYGPQRLLRERVLSPSLVFGSDEFLWAAAQWPRRPPRFVTTYAIDVARDAEGRWILLTDQTDAPTGLGWAVASRFALAQALGGVFLETGVHRLGGYLAQLDDALLDAAGDRGRAVLLSPGPADPSYFSHAFLARYLGVPLIETADLTRRDGRVYLKTLEGLQAVGAILRKRPARELDPLYLPGFGDGGTPGLLDAARLGSLRMVNAFGSGFAQHRTLGPFVEPLARHLLGESPAMAEAPLRWLGDPVARREVIGSPAWRIGPLTARQDPGSGDHRGFTTEPDPDLARRIARDGHRWAAQRAVPLATTPCWRGGRLEPVPWAMRLFACVVGDRVHVLPGGLGRLSSRPAALGLPSGAGSKDVWVMAPPHETPVPTLLSQRMAEVTLQREARDLLAGMADALFWLGRYTERAQSTLRLLRAVLARLLEAGAAHDTARLTGHLLAGHLAPAPDDERPPATRLAVAVSHLLQSPDCVNGLAPALAAIQRNATLSRGVLSQDSWSALNTLVADRRWRLDLGPILAQPPVELVDDAIRLLVAFAGTAAEHMTRNDAWRFLDMGVRLERALQVTALVDRGVRPPEDADREAALAALLEIGDSHMTYRSRYAALPLPVPVLDLLLLDETNPRGLLYQVVQLERVLMDLPADGIYRSPAQRLALELATRLRLVDARDLAPTGPGDRLDALAADVRRTLATLSDQVHRAYFVMAETPTTTFSGRGLER